jgi:hypothetical protein
MGIQLWCVCKIRSHGPCNRNRNRNRNRLNWP